MNAIGKYLNEVSQTLQELPQAEMARAIQVLERARSEGRRVYVMGNGASAAMASHLICDLAKGTVQEGRPRFRAIGLNNNIPLLTNYGNDHGYETVFSEPLASLRDPCDVVVAIISSGNSFHVLNAVDVARERGMVTIGITGLEGGQLAEKADFCVIIPADPRHPSLQQEDCQWVVLHSIFVTVRQGLG